jgi:hypothetical protein
MPAHSISINTPTNARIRQVVADLEQSYVHTQPDQFIYGGGKVSEYAQSGNNGAYPSSHMEHVEGGSIKKTAKNKQRESLMR